MKNEPIPVDVALINLYNATRRASLPLDEHDANRAYVDVLAQALNIKLQWTAPAQVEDSNNQVQPTTAPQSPDAPKQVDLVGLNKNGKKKY